jgi:hypothetical protein
MKEIITEITEPNYVTIQKGNKTRKIKQYQAEDGKIFDKKDEAENHDFKLKFDKIEHIGDNVISELGYDWYRAKNEDELALIKERLVWSYSYVHGLENIKVGEWFNYRIDNGGDYRDNIYFTTLSEFENEISELTHLLKG